MYVTHLQFHRIFYTSIHRPKQINDILKNLSYLIYKFFQSMLPSISINQQQIYLSLAYIFMQLSTHISIFFNLFIRLFIIYLYILICIYQSLYYNLRRIAAEDILNLMNDQVRKWGIDTRLVTLSDPKVVGDRHKAGQPLISKVS